MSILLFWYICDANLCKSSCRWTGPLRGITFFPPTAFRHISSNIWASFSHSPPISQKCGSCSIFIGADSKTIRSLFEVQEETQHSSIEAPLPTVFFLCVCHICFESSTSKKKLKKKYFFFIRCCELLIVDKYSISFAGICVKSCFTGWHFPHRKSFLPPPMYLFLLSATPDYCGRAAEVHLYTMCHKEATFYGTNEL